jgi:hypothetical protein
MYNSILGQDLKSNSMYLSIAQRDDMKPVSLLHRYTAEDEDETPKKGV